MNIYDFFVSEDIAAYCMKINYKFSPLDTAVIVYLSCKPIQKKHEAYRQIINEFPDIAINKRVDFAAQNSLHDYLRKLMDYENRAIENLAKSDSNAVFRSELQFNGYDIEVCQGYFSSFKKAKNAVFEWGWEENGITGAVIRKIIMDDKESDYYLDIDRNGEITGVCYDEYCEGDFLDFLDMIYFNLPLPFKKGDIVTFGDGVPCVLMQISLRDGDKKHEDYITGKRGDSSDMRPIYIDISEGGQLVRKHEYFIWQMRYYKSELKGNKRFLKHLGEYLIKNQENGFHWLMSVYMKYYAESQSEYWNSFFEGEFIPLEE